MQTNFHIKRALDSSVKLFAGKCVLVNFTEIAEGTGDYNLLLVKIWVKISRLLQVFVYEAHIPFLLIS